MNGLPWMILGVEEQGHKHQHVIPTLDLKFHLPTLQCWCRPEETDEPDVWSHKAMDGREAYETGERKLQ